MNLTDAVEQVVASLPADLAPALETVVFQVEDAHPLGWRGSYHGVPLPARVGRPGLAPSVITLYFDQLAGLTVDHVRYVVLHELRHHFGQTHEDMAATGRA